MIIAIALLPLPEMAQNNMNFSNYGRIVAGHYVQFAIGGLGRLVGSPMGAPSIRCWRVVAPCVLGLAVARQRLCSCDARTF